MDWLEVTFLLQYRALGGGLLSCDRSLLHMISLDGGGRVMPDNGDKDPQPKVHDQALKLD